MLYGRPTKHVRHVDHDNFTIEPQRFQVHSFWRSAPNAATARTDGQDLQDENLLPLGSKISNHRIEMLITPETIEPQQIYMGIIALSFADIYHPSICGGYFEQASYQDTATENFNVTSNAITPQLFPNYDAGNNLIVDGVDVANREIGGSGSGYGIAEWKLDDTIKHWIRTKKATIYDQRPLVSDRKQSIPSKVKRANEGTMYGLWIFNDSVRGATPADTQITVDIKSTYNEMAI